MKKYLIPTALLLVTALSSCTKTIDEDLSGNERSLLELRVEGQMGTAIIDRDGSRATATVYILETPGFAYDRVPVKGIVVSEGASASVGNGDVLNFSNPERRARITVTSRSGHRLDWWIYLETYDPFFLGTWRIVDVKLACNQRVSGVGDGAWTTQLSSGEFGTYGLPEYDDRVTITLGEISDNELTGTLVHSAGDDGAYGNFWGVYAPYSVEAPLDMNPRLRHLLPPGESQWTLDLTTNQMFEPMYGSIVLEMVSDAPAGEILGETTKEYTFEACGETLDMTQLQEIWEAKLEPVYPYRKAGPTVELVTGSLTAPAAPKIGVAKPKVIIPVFPGTNCEYDTAKAFARAGADPEILVIRNLTPADVTASCEALVKAIDNSQIVMLPGGFSGGDEPDGSAKFIASFFRNPAVTEAVRRLLQQRDGLMLGICNGFQALIKLGLVPYGDIRPITACDPTLTFNTIGRHQSMLVHTRVASTGSPWLSKCEVGEMHTIAISHGEGRFVAPQEVLDTMLRNGQVATQYVDLTGVPTMDQSFNPNGSVLAIEGITSPDGRVFGKMGHSERSGEYLYKNVTGDKYQPIFEGGVDYFKV